MLAAGAQLERYIVEGELGEGGMATVYRVRHSALGSLHALKLLHARGSSLRERLLQEGRLQATLRHRNIVAVTDVIDIDGSPGLVMEFIPGKPLDVWLDTTPYDLAARLAIFRGILAGVGAAHAAGLVHRDLKPANVLLDASEAPPVPKVADFGIAKLVEEDGPGRTRSGMAMGTLAYMSPEQTRNAKGVDSRCDIYALACMLYEMACDKRPFDGSDLWEVLQAKMASRYPDPRAIRPDLPDAVVLAIRYGLAPDVEQRLPDVETFRRVLAGDMVLDDLERRLGRLRVALPSSATMLGDLDEPEGSLAPTPAPSGPVRTSETFADDGFAPPSVAPSGPGRGAPAAAPGAIAVLSSPEPTLDAHRAVGGSRAPLVAGVAAAVVLAVALGTWAATRPAVELATAAAPSPSDVASTTPPAPDGGLATAPPTVPATAPTTAQAAPAAPAPLPSAAAAKPTAAVAKPTARAAEPAATQSPAATLTTLPAAEEAAPVATGTVTVSGPISAAWLEDSGGERHKPGALTPGVYQLRVRFEGATDFVPVATVTLRAGQAITYRCDGSFGMCTQASGS